MRQVPAQTVEAVLSGMASLGADVALIRAQAGLPARPSVFGELWPHDALGVAWMHTMRAFPRATVAAEVALAIPFGAFGVVDYLIASAHTVGGALHALVTHFGAVTTSPALALVEDEDGVRLEARAPDIPIPWISEEFTLVMTLKSIRHVAAGPAPVTALRVTTADRGGDALGVLLGVPVRYGCPVAALCFEPSVKSLPLRTADPFHRAVTSLATSLHLGDATDPLEQAVRARLRDLLPAGDSSAARVARTLGMSERTLHRRLLARGTTWRAVIDRFRSDESKRLLGEGRFPLAEIAQRVGFSEQSAWQRAFRRWTGRSPGRWVREAGAHAAHAD